MNAPWNTPPLIATPRICRRCLSARDLYNLARRFERFVRKDEVGDATAPVQLRPEELDE